MDFFPKGYDGPPSDSLYMKLQNGENKFRVLSPMVAGWEFWDGPEGERTPKRFTADNKPKSKDVPEGERITHFWAFKVYNYNEKAIQIFQINQSTIQKPLTNLINSDDWGNPMEYDIQISKQGEGLKTEYTVMPGKNGPVSKDVAKLDKDTPVNLEALFTGEDPFEA